MPTATDCQSLIVMGISLVTAYIDFHKYRISNRCVLATLLIGVIWNTWFFSMVGVKHSLLGTLAGLLLLLPGYSLGQISAGDVKWLSALGAWYGPKGTLGLFLVASIAHGLIAILWLARFSCRNSADIEQSSLPPEGSIDRIDAIMNSSGRNRRLIPYAVPVAMAVLFIESLKRI